MKEVLPDDVAKLLDYDSYKLLEEQEHEFEKRRGSWFLCHPL